MNDWRRRTRAARGRLALLIVLFLAGQGRASSAVCAADGQSSPRQNAERPNIVVVFIDDLGYADIGPFGATKQRTPHLDRMAREGMKLTSFYAAPVCSVSRAQLLTGCYGARVSVPGVFGPGSAQGLHPDETTIAERLKPLGYATMCVGKWHVGDQFEFLPTRQGFDHYFGIPYSNDMQRKSASTGEMVAPLLRDEKVVELLRDEQQSRLVERYTEAAETFIRDHARQPFLLYLPHSAVHTPIWPGEKFRGRSNNGRFGDWVEEVDWSVGRILDTLRELKLEERTLVLFTSDNGPWLIKGADGGSALPLRGGKGSTWEGGVRVPTIAWWPGKIAPGSVCDAVTGTIDILPTAVKLAGGQLPAEPILDGRDLTPLLMGLSSASPREAHYYFAGYNLQAVRQGPWKLALATQPETMGKEAAADARKNPRLYNLDAEIGERTDVSEQHPEIVARLQALAERMNAEIGGSLPKARRPAGVAAYPTTLYPTIPSAKPAPAAKGAGIAAPQVAERPWKLRCRVTAASDAQGVVVAHGGSLVGYAVYLKDGRATFVVRDRGELRRVESEWRGSDAPQTIEASLAADGQMTLRIGDAPQVAAAALGLLSRQPKENFCIGHDDGAPVADYGVPARFPGKVEVLSP